MKNNKNNQKARYSLAPASKRILARFFDLLIVCLLSIAVFCSLTLWIIINNKKNYDNKLFSGMILLSFFISFMLFFAYFIVIPYFWKGYTFFKKIFKIKTHELINDKYFFFHLIKKEFFIWIILFILNFIFSFILFFYNDPLSIMSKLLMFNFTYKDNKYIFIPIFQFFYVIFFIPSLIITVHLSLNSRKRALHDFFSDTCVISTIPLKDDNSTNEINVIYNYDLPGVIDESALEELNND